MPIGDNGSTKKELDEIEDLHDLPEIDSSDNESIRDAVGNKSDGHFGSSLHSRTHELDEHIHSNIFIRPNMANGITVSKASGAWAAYPTPTQIIAANDINEEFDLHFLNVSTISANGQYQLQFYTGPALSEVSLGDGFAISRSASQSQEGTRPIMTARMPANTRISVALTGSPAGIQSVIVKIEGHRY